MPKPKTERVDKQKFEPEELIEQAIDRYGDNIAVACAFGKDSITILHMALKYKSDIKVVFCNTGIEFPETIEYKEQIKKEWNLNLIETKPYKYAFWQCVERYGLPEFRSTKSKYHSPRCCYYLKEKPAMLLYKQLGIKAIFTGLRAEEGRNRAMLVARMDNLDDVRFCGQRYYAKSWNLWKYHPIAYWKENEVWDYIKQNNIPINPVYTKWNGIYKRCGCLPCTGYINWDKKLSKTHPSLYKVIQEKRGQKLISYA